MSDNQTPEVPEEDFNEEQQPVNIDIDASILSSLQQAKIARNEAENLLDIAAESDKEEVFLSTAVPLVINDIGTAETVAATLLAGKQVSDGLNANAQVSAMNNAMNIEQLERIGNGIERLVVVFEGMSEIFRHINRAFDTFTKTKLKLDESRNTITKKFGGK